MSNYRFLPKLKSFARRQLRLPSPLVHEQLLGQQLVVRYGTIRYPPDYDDAWLLACALRAEVVFDVGASVGFSALLVLLCKRVKKVVLVEANPSSLSIAAENLIRNQLASQAHFVSAFVGNVDHSTAKLWTIGTGSAGSIYATHAKSAAKSKRFIEVPTVTLDALCDLYETIPDLVKIDVEGAEYQVLQGGKECASHQKTRFLVEMHSNSELSMEDNATKVLEWCHSVGYQAWYLKENVRLENTTPIQHRGRCHLLLQPAAWSYPEWLEGIEQSADLEMVFSKANSKK